MNVILDIKPKMSRFVIGHAGGFQSCSHSVAGQNLNSGKLIEELRGKISKELERADVVTITSPCALDKEKIKALLLKNNGCKLNIVPNAVALAAELSSTRLAKGQGQLAFFVVIEEWHTELVFLRIDENRVVVKRRKSIPLGAENWALATAELLSKKISCASSAISDLSDLIERTKVNLTKAKRTCLRFGKDSFEITIDEYEKACEKEYQLLCNEIDDFFQSVPECDCAYMSGACGELPALRKWLSEKFSNKNDVKAFWNPDAGIKGLMKIVGGTVSLVDETSCDHISKSDNASDDSICPQCPYSKNDFDPESMLRFSAWIEKFLNEDRDPLVMIEMSVNSRGDADVVKIHSERLPWLDEAYRAKLQNEYAEIAKLWPMRKFDSNVVRKIAKSLLERGLRDDTSHPVEVDICPSIYWNLWHSEDALKIDVISDFDACSEGDARYRESSRGISMDDLTIEVIDLAPFKPISVQIHPKKACFIENISFDCHGFSVHIPIGQPIDAGMAVTFVSTTIPPLAVLRQWWHQHGASVPIQVDFPEGHIVVQGGISLNNECGKFESGMINLSVDIGSTQTKIISTFVKSVDSDLPLDYNPYAGNISKSKYKHQYFTTNGLGSFCEAHDLPYFRKEDIAQQFKKGRDEDGIESLSLFIASAVKRMAIENYETGFTIANVFWSFPCLSLTNNDGGMNSSHFVAVEKRVAVVLRPYVMGNFHLYPEHLALKHMFDHVLAHLYSRALSEKARIEAINERRDLEADAKYKRDQDDYDAAKRSAGSWLFHPVKRWKLKKNAPTRTVVTYEYLSSCFKQCLDQGDGLGDFLILDAGGCTLDVYGVRNGEKILATSYSAGGETITDAFVAELIKNFYDNAVCPDADVRDKAMQTKVRTASRLEENPMSEDPYKDLLFESTKSVYTEALSEIARKMQGHKRLVVVVTGGGARNPAFIDLVKHYFSGNINLTSSIILGDLVVQDEKLKEDKLLYAFAACSHDQGFKGDQSGQDIDNPATSRCDVAGGMLIHYQSLRKR